MLKTRIIPCLDVKNGRVVKGTNFINLRDAGDPVEIAKIYNDKGADELCFLDISASQENRNTTYEIVKKTAREFNLPYNEYKTTRSALLSHFKFLKKMGVKPIYIKS